MISNEQLAEWERLANEATEGPWKSFLTREFGSVSMANDPTTEVCYADTDENFANDCNFIAAARAAVPALIEDVRRLRAELEKTSNERSDFGVIGYFQGRSEARDVVRQLKKEADWLAGILGKSDVCARAVAGDDPDKFTCADYNDSAKCTKCCRELARLAIQAS